MQKLIRVRTDDLDVETTIRLDDEGKMCEFHEGCLPDDVVERAMDILDGQDLRRTKNVNVLFQGDDVQLNFDPVGETYRWAAPHEWLGYHVQEKLDDADELLRLLGIIGPLVNPDSLIDALFGDLNADGYYKKLHPNCKQCGRVQTLYLAPWGQYCYGCKQIVEDAVETLDVGAAEE